MAQIMRKHLAFRYACHLAEAFHFCPDIFPIHRTAGAGNKNAAICTPLFSAVGLQKLRKRTGQKNYSFLSLGSDMDDSCLQCFYCNILQFADPDASGANGLHNTAQTVFTLFQGRVYQSLIFLRSFWYCNISNFFTKVIVVYYIPSDNVTILW